MKCLLSKISKGAFVISFSRRTLNSWPQKDLQLAVHNVMILSPPNHLHATRTRYYSAGDNYRHTLIPLYGHWNQRQRADASRYWFHRRRAFQKQPNLSSVVAGSYFL